MECHLNAARSDNVTSLQGLYTDFDDWVARYNKCCQRSTHTYKNITRNSEKLPQDFFIADILLKQRPKLQTAKTNTSHNFFKENDGFMYYDYILHRFINKNGGKRIIFQYRRSKL